MKANLEVKSNMSDNEKAPEEKVEPTESRQRHKGRGSVKEVGFDITGMEDLVDQTVILEEEVVQDGTIPEIIRCSSHTDPNKLGWFIVRLLNERPFVQIQTIGPPALAKAGMAIVRAQAICSQYSAGSILVRRDSIRIIKLRNGDEKTAVLMRIWPIPTAYAV